MEWLCFVIRNTIYVKEGFAMSHFSKIKTELSDAECLKKALKDLGYQIKENSIVRGFGSLSTRADVVVTMPNGYDIGFRKRGDFFELVADLWGLSIDKDDFLNEVTQRYAMHVVIDKAMAEGFQIVNEEELEDGSIRIVCEREVEHQEKSAVQA